MIDYQYDAIGQITNVLTDGVSTETYRYDANGNRLEAVVDGLVSIAEYDAQDRMIRYGDTTFAYDVNGTTLSSTNVSGGVTTYDYGSCGELRGVGLADGTDISYETDPLNRRVGRSVNGTPVQQFIYKDALNPVAEIDGDGTITATFVYGAKANVPELMIKNGTTYRLITDPNGSVRQVISTTDSSVVQCIDYDAFGRVTSDTNPGFQPFGFQGGLYDPLTGLVRFGARDYNPETGRWLSKDPIGISGGLNLYAFCGNNPVNFVDPLGFCGSEYSALRVYGNIFHGVGRYLKAGVEGLIALDMGTGAVILYLGGSAANGFNPGSGDFFMDSAKIGLEISTDAMIYSGEDFELGSDSFRDAAVELATPIHEMVPPLD